LNSYFSKLNPSERRFVVVVGLVFFLVINIFFVWPHFSDWSALKDKLGAAQDTQDKYDKVFQLTNTLARQVDQMQRAGADVPPEDQSVQFMHTIQTQAAQSHVNPTAYGRQLTRTNQFFIDQIQTITLQSGEKELVDFLYNLGSGGSLVRARDLTVRPDPQHHQLIANITLVASFQKNPKTRASSPAPAARAPAQKPATTPNPAPATAPRPNSTPKKK
jgi:hypothetical protein